MTDNLESFSRDIDVTKAATEQSAAELARASAQWEQISGRVQALAHERSAIIARRGAGDPRDDDGPALQLNSADTESLMAMLSEAETIRTSAATVFAQARQAHVAAQAAYKAEEERLALLKLDQHAVDLMNALAKTLIERRAVASALQITERAVGNVTNRLAGFDQIMCAEMATLQGLRRGPAPHPVQPIWQPSDTLYDAVMRLHGVDGLFV